MNTRVTSLLSGYFVTSAHEYMVLRDFFETAPSGSQEKVGIFRGLISMVFFGSQRRFSDQKLQKMRYQV